MSTTPTGITTFTDRGGQTWDLALTVGAAKRVKTHTGLNLYDALGDTLIPTLVQDAAALVDVIFSILQPQAEQRGVTDEQFAELLDGVVLEAATAAFLEALAGFFARPGQRQAVRGLIEKTNQTLDAAEKLAQARIGQINPDDIVAQIDQQPPTSSG